MEKDKVIDLGERVPKLKQEIRKKANYRLIFYIFFFFFVMVLVLYFQSVFGNVSNVEVEGNKYVKKEEVMQLAEFTNETSYWKISEAEVEGKIKKHDEIQAVTVTKKFPNNVHIQIEEYGTIGYLVKDSSYHPVLESGRILDAPVEGVFPVRAPLLYSFRQGDELQELAAEMAILPESIRESISEIHYVAKESTPLAIMLFMSEGFEVHVTIDDFANKMSAYPGIAEDKKNLPGIINLHKRPMYTQYKTAE